MRMNLTRVALGLLFLAGAARGAQITPEPWPREFTTPKGNTAVMYQPQIETFKGSTITGRAAVSVTKKDDKTEQVPLPPSSATLIPGLLCGQVKCN